MARRNQSRAGNGLRSVSAASAIVKPNADALASSTAGFTLAADDAPQISASVHPYEAPMLLTTKMFGQQRDRPAS